MDSTQRNGPFLYESLHYPSLSQQAIRKELRQKTMRFPFVRPANVRENRLNAAWKRIASELLYGELP
jgi:hypothetical protein